MLLKFIVKNLFSFKEQTEFNLFPNKTTRLPHHKINLGGIDVLRLSAIYGANGSGKSNLIKSVGLLQSIIQVGVIETGIENNRFKLSSVNKNLPIEMGIEFYSNSKNYYYAIAINNNQVIYEYLAESKKNKDVLIFERKIENETQSIKFFDKYYDDPSSRLFVSILEKKILEKNQLLFTFLNKKYENEFMDVKNAFDWFEDTLTIIYPETKTDDLVHILDLNKTTVEFANDLISSFNTGITKLGVDKKSAEDILELSDYNELKKTCKYLKMDNYEPFYVKKLKIDEKEEFFYINEDDKIITKKLFTEHTDDENNPIEFTLPEESDGTRRLLDYIPAIESLINQQKVFLIDEIERSIHPLTIKKIISKFSLDEQAKGQLIFTTHESNLLDQDILRTDEIWFTQKDFDGATKLFSLSDYKVHNTIDIENGYLNGRYGGIPFLSNLEKT
ncbi:MAG: ATP-binding protein [Sphingobacteriales bacterium]|nr:MAG: ATP-binding protein [Sphingobacteriales bacterium]TAF78464.1 MAG: ATP-binding protein [Sphingobacteriales bacterium]